MTFSRRCVLGTALFVACLVSALPQAVFGDGMMFVPMPDDDSWTHMPERAQEAVIAHKDGVEHLLLAVTVDGPPEGALWLFPIPTTPDKATLRMTAEIPSYEGIDVLKRAAREVGTIRERLILTQWYTAPFYVVRGLFGMSTGLDSTGFTAPLGMEYRNGSGVTVHQRVSLDGVTSEILTARTAVELYRYLEDVGVPIRAGSIPILDEYIREGHSFVATRVVGSGQGGVANGEHVLGVEVSFPTERIYFPLKPTSVYGTTTVPAVIRVVGHVSPAVFRDIAPFTEVQYLAYDSFWIPRARTDGSPIAPVEEADGVWRMRSGDPYTRIDITAPAEAFTEDLWIDTWRPFGVVLGDLVQRLSWLVDVIVLVVCSVLAGIVAGRVTLPHVARRTGRLALMGLANILTLSGVMVAAIFTRTGHEDDPQAVPTLEILRAGGVVRRRKIGLALLVLFPVAALAMILGWEVISDCCSDDIYRTFHVWGWQYEEDLFFAALALYLCVVAFFALIPKRYAQHVRTLKSLGYSRWTFEREGRKRRFVIVFSVVFLVLVVASTGLLTLAFGVTPW